MMLATRSVGSRIRAAAAGDSMSTTGAARSSRSRTLSVAAAVPVTPSMSIALAVTSTVPGAEGTKRARPKPSKAMTVPAIFSSRLAMSAIPEVATWTRTCCPAATAKLGVNSIRTSGGMGACETTSVRLPRAVASPSETKNTRSCSPTWAAVGVQVNCPVAELRAAPTGSTPEL